MKTIVIFFLLHVCVIFISLAQSEGRFQFFGRTRVISPQVNEDQTVTFRLLAPNAEKVTVNISGVKPIDMTKESDGVWSVTTDKLTPDIYQYEFVSDGLTIPDPSNPAITSSYKIKVGQSLVEMPGQIPLWEQRQVPHGTISQYFYESKIIGGNQNFYAYFPPDYDPKRKKPYPILYLLHGLTENAESWFVAGRANFILDNLIAERKIEPMLIVCPLGYGDPDDIVKGYGGPFERFTQSLLEEVIPIVESKYNVGKTSSHRAITGLSMGGGQSLFIGLNHPDKFGYVGGFSSAVVMYGMNRDRSTVKQPELLLDSALFQKVFPNLDASINKKLKRLWIATGDQDGEFNFSLEFKYWLRSKDIRFDEVIVPGQHTWIVWRKNLVDFSQVIFK